MKTTRIVKNILENYESDNPGTKSNLAKILMHGKLSGTGKLVILPVDQVMNMVQLDLSHQIQMHMIHIIILK